MFDDITDVDLVNGLCEGISILVDNNKPTFNVRISETNYKLAVELNNQVKQSTGKNQSITKTINKALNKALLEIKASTK